jgi:GNAT superfamily N-acetyltransferase
MNKENDQQPILSHVEPVLAVQNILETISYWHDILGFPNKWTWGEPPNHGGVSWHGVFVQFTINPALPVAPGGNSMWIRVQNLQTLYTLHQRNKADIVSPLVNKPWGMAEYIVREINGYYLTFSAPVTDKKHSAERLPETVRIIARTPTASEYRNLISAVGWEDFTNIELVDAILAPVLFAAVAENTENGEVIGCALLLGDNTSFFYVKDLMVHPAWQGKRVGSSLMQKLTNWLETNAPDNSFVGLFTGEQLALFYQQFGFTKSFGMHRRISR